MAVQHHDPPVSMPGVVAAAGGGAARALSLLAVRLAARLI